MSSFREPHLLSHHFLLHNLHLQREESTFIHSSIYSQRHSFLHFYPTSLTHEQAQLLSKTKHSSLLSTNKVNCAEMALTRYMHPSPFACFSCCVCLKWRRCAVVLCRAKNQWTLDENMAAELNHFLNEAVTSVTLFSYRSDQLLLHQNNLLITSTLI